MLILTPLNRDGVDYVISKDQVLIYAAFVIIFHISILHHVSSSLKLIIHD